MREKKIRTFVLMVLLSTVVTSCHDGTDTVDSEGDGGSDTDTDTDTETSTTSYDGPAFTTVWKTDNPGGTGEYQIRIPLVPNGEYDFIIDWGDGSSEHMDYWFDSGRTHTYRSPGIYEVEIRGLIKGWAFRNTADAEKIIEIKNWGPFGFGDTFEYFYGCTNLTITATDVPDLTGTNGLRAAFQQCTSLTSVPSMSDWDTSSVKDMSYMFFGSPAFNEDISGWDTSSVTDMSFMFSGAVAFNADISGWDTSSVTDMEEMFSSAMSFDQNIGDWDTSSVVRMIGMFVNADSFDQDISSWDIANVQNIDLMFLGVTLSTTNYDALLIGWENQDPPNGLYFHGGHSQYSKGAATEARARLIDEHDWTIQDGGEV